mgnify:FL=1
MQSLDRQPLYFPKCYKITPSLIPPHATFTGTGVVDIIIKEVVVVSITMPPMTIDDFFGENIISNLATFLGVPANKIRIVDVVRETSSRKRETDGTTVNFEIGKLQVMSGSV